MTQPRVKIITHRAKTRDGYEVEFRGGRRFSMKADTDVELDDAVKRAGLWKKAGEYPYFTIYKDGEEVGGGGGSNSGAMDSKGPRVRVYTHRTRAARDGVDILGRSAGGSFYIGKNAYGKFVVGGVRQKTGPGTEVEFNDLQSAQNHYEWLVKEYD